MRTKNAARITQRESEHLAAVKSVACSVCGASGPSEAHHVKQGRHFTCISLCIECHRGANGWHGDKTLWRIYKMDEIDALNETLRMVDELEKLD